MHRMGDAGMRIARARPVPLDRGMRTTPGNRHPPAMVRGHPAGFLFAVKASRYITHM